MSICVLCQLPEQTTQETLCPKCHLNRITKTSDDPETWECDCVACTHTQSETVSPSEVCGACRDGLGI